MGKEPSAAFFRSNAPYNDGLTAD